jgi:hypothetical protein
MGKSVGFLGPISGRVGNTVGYVLKDASKQTQGWRVYQPNVGNPQTDSQMQQRIRLTAINNQYRGLKEIITRGFEGLAYGNVSRRKYLSMAMGQRFEGPWLAKDDKRPVPVLNVPVTVGSLPQIVCAVDSSAVDYFTTNLTFADEVTPITLGILSGAFIASGYQEGDQVTFILAKYIDGGAVLTHWESIYLDSQSSDPLPSVLDGIISIGLQGEVEVSRVDGWAPNALAISVSRGEEGSHLRSTAYWAIDDIMEGAFYADASYRQNSPSYIRHRSASTNWELDAEVEGGSGGGGGSVQLAYTISGLEIEPQGLTVYSTNHPIQIIGANGNQFYIRTKVSNELAYVNAAGTTVSSIDGATNANTVDVYLERNKAQNLRAWLIAQGINASILPAYT